MTRLAEISKDNLQAAILDFMSSRALIGRDEYIENISLGVETIPLVIVREEVR